MHAIVADWGSVCLAHLHLSEHSVANATCSEGLCPLMGNELHPSLAVAHWSFHKENSLSTTNLESGQAGSRNQRLAPQST